MAMNKYCVILSNRVSLGEARLFKQRCLDDSLFNDVDTKFKIIPDGSKKYYVIRSISKDEFNTPKSYDVDKHIQWQRNVIAHTRRIAKYLKRSKR